MMNESEHLLVILMEECAEVQQATSKALRFGVNEVYKDYGSNKERIEDEVCDLMATLEMLFDRKIISLPDDYESRIKAKQEKVLRYMEYARKDCGVLE